MIMTTMNNPLRIFTSLLLVLMTGSTLAQASGGAFVKANRVDLVSKARTEGDINIIVG